MTPYFEGVTTHGEGTSFYRVTYCGMPFPACYQGQPKRLLVENEYKYHEIQYAWGYEGIAGDTLAMDILRVYAGYDASWTHNRGLKLYGTQYGGLRYDCPEPRDPPLPLQFIDTRYQQFAADVIANLPDNWKLTFEEIDRWVEKQEQQTKGKDNEPGETTQT